MPDDAGLRFQAACEEAGMGDLGVEGQVGEADLVALAHLVAQTLLEAMGEDAHRHRRGTVARIDDAEGDAGHLRSGPGREDEVVDLPTLDGRDRRAARQLEMEVRRRFEGEPGHRVVGGEPIVGPGLDGRPVDAAEAILVDDQAAEAIRAVAQPEEVAGDRRRAATSLRAQDARLVGQSLERQVREVVGELAQEATDLVGWIRERGRPCARGRRSRSARMASARSGRGRGARRGG